MSHEPSGVSLEKRVEERAREKLKYSCQICLPKSQVTGGGGKESEKKKGPINPDKVRKRECATA